MDLLFTFPRASERTLQKVTLVWKISPEFCSDGNHVRPFRNTLWSSFKSVYVVLG